jgi:DNA-binding NarL/FixJ family response regulator
MGEGGHMVKKRIIVLDDEPLIASLMKEVIEENQEFEVAQIATGKNEFLSVVSHNSFDAALIDISVGGREGGIELLQIIKNKAIDLPLIMLSAHDELYYALKCLQAGAKGYINKRYICTDISTCLKEVLGGHLYVSGDKGEQILKQYRKLNTFASIESL